MKKNKEHPEKSIGRVPALKPIDDSARVTSSDSEPTARASFPIVGVGASAGGLEAFTQLFSELPADTGMAFVLIQHLNPSHPSLLAEALSRATTMSVTQAKDGERVEPNHVYVIPPNADIAILHGLLTLVPRREDGHKLHLPVDFFFRALAAECRNHAIGVVLSGTASDGTEGLKAIKGEEGITFAQDPKSAKFEGMPRNAINAGVVDYCLPIPKLAQELIRLGRHPYLSAARVGVAKNDDATFKKIFIIMRNAVGVDFSEYKAPTFERRLARRMALRKVETPTTYLELLQTDAAEVTRLYEDLLIHVTSFFRDPDLFEGLKAHVFPEILKHKSAGGPIRIWVAGCSMGEEVYSLAISLLEFLGDSPCGHPIQIFGSDIGEKAIEKARLGLYPDIAMRDISDERRRRYFTQVETGYRINKTVRDLCVFVRHDLARDPPFSKLDLVSCRNVLIYFDQALQKRVLLTFHYALNQPGFLLLGHAEDISGFGQLFSLVDKSSKIFARTPAASTLRFAPRSEVPPAAPMINRESTADRRRGVDVAKHLDRLLLARYSPPGVLINQGMEILQFRGETGAYLRPAPGEPQYNLIKMARGGLIAPLRAVIAQAKKEMAPVRMEAVEVVDPNEVSRICNIIVEPFTAIADAKERLFVVLFEETSSSRATGKPGKAKSRRETETGRVAKLERELAATTEYLQSLVDQQDQTNNDLNSANEELVSSNEELQSLNEELETAKEELQSTNEELNTVNDELQNRNQDIAHVNSDLVNLLATVDVPILILDRNKRIRRCTPKAQNVLNVLPSDVGRPFDDIKSNLQLTNLDRQIAEVIETNTMHESEVQDRDGRWYRMQIRPYKNIDNKIDGATLSLVDIDALKHHISEAERAKGEAEQANRAKDEFLAVLSHEIRTPLSSMLLQAQFLLRGNLGGAQAKRAAEVIERGTRLQVKLIDDLLDVSRIVTGKLKIDFQAVDLCAVIRAALEGVNAPAQRKALKFKVVLDETIGTVLGDPTRLQQVVANLLNNAIKFTPENGDVTLVLDSADGQARLKISDNGMGIEPAFLPYVFNRFAQEDSSTVRRHGGLGLGLAIAHHLVEAHGGTIQAESQGRGKGATFSVALPLMQGHADGVVGAREPTSTASTSKTAVNIASYKSSLNNLRILVVDDDLGTRDAVVDMLSQTGAQVQVAESAREAMTVIENFQPDVLLCDIAMPGEDGYSLIRRVRALGPGRGGNILALALTALAGEENRLRALSAGFQMYLAKPVDVDSLMQALVDVSHMRAAMDSLAMHEGNPQGGAAWGS